MKELENEVRAVKKDGLLWGTCKSYKEFRLCLVCSALQSTCTVAACGHDTQRVNSQCSVLPAPEVFAQKLQSHVLT